MFKFTEGLIDKDGEGQQRIVETDQLSNEMVERMTESILGLKRIYSDDGENQEGEDEYAVEEGLVRQLLDEEIQIERDIEDLKRRMDYLESVISKKHLKETR